MKYAVMGAVLLAALVVGAATGVRWEKGQQAVRDLAIAEQQKLVFAKHRNTERGWMDDVSAARNQRTEREQTLKADAAIARAERDGLRDDLAGINSRLATASADAVRKYAAAANDVFEQCSRAYQGMAETADGHAADSLMYQQGWPKRK